MSIKKECINLFKDGIVRGVLDGLVQFTKETAISMLTNWAR